MKRYCEMKTFISKIRVLYSDTDQMGCVHHSNYLKYYETARWELFRQLGIPYREIEEKGILLPVIKVTLKFINPAFYDQELTIETTIQPCKGARIGFSYRLLNEAKELINEAEISLACVNKETGRPCYPPAFIAEKINSYFEKISDCGCSDPDS